MSGVGLRSSATHTFDKLLERAWRQAGCRFVDIAMREVDQHPQGGSPRSEGLRRLLLAVPPAPEVIGAESREPLLDKRHASES